MSITEKILAWRQLSPAQQLEITRKALPNHIAMSMAMEGEPVALEIILQQFDAHIAKRAVAGSTERHITKDGDEF